jgi:hypothetical protein
MAPEQARGEALTAQSDLFALGVLAWEMVTGRRLFSRASADETVAAVAAAAVPAPVTVRPEVPARLDAIIMRRRWRRSRPIAGRNAGELAAALQRYLRPMRPTRWSGRASWPPWWRAVTPPIVHVAAERSGPTTAIDLASTAGDEAGAPPATPVVPRAQPRGKRAATAREATFATHVELERALGPRTAPHPRPTPPTTVAVPRPSAPTMAAVEPAPEPTSPSGSTAALAEPTAMAAPEPTAPASRRRARGLFAGATALALLAVAALLAWPRGERATTVAIDAAPPPPIDAAPPPPDAAPPPPIDAAPAPLPPIDAGPPSPPRDAPPRDAGRAATGVLRVGANPWGEVLPRRSPPGPRAERVDRAGRRARGRRRVPGRRRRDPAALRSVEVPAGDRAVGVRRLRRAVTGDRGLTGKSSGSTVTVGRSSPRAHAVIATASDRGQRPRRRRSSSQRRRAPPSPPPPTGVPPVGRSRGSSASTRSVAMRRRRRAAGAQERERRAADRHGDRVADLDHRGAGRARQWQR